MKYIIVGISVLLLLAGCSSNQPQPKPVEKKVEEKPVKKTAPRRSGSEPPVQEVEEDVDMSRIVEEATAEVLAGDTTQYR